ncbi:uncharacterized protein J7T54_000251 [Emericellopsis cladophorae]|uniref:Uncharacterized protein n=1 Tax=Emericellopsis cladophorae TaxID=2686198 RepID=A0A9P9XXX8_9HYPO|nr:uncharacterized protein J7T54_000251 [Emericellopsis cladophorae]KAI6779951.1 hypothetical protein J7T54_000251 [Emericellopsis cladophorae]
MAGPIQLGDVVKLAEFAWTVYDYGWSPEHNAGENYSAFGADVYTLHASLRQLDEAIMRALQSPVAHGATGNGTTIGDRRSLNEIIGDYSDTLRACMEFLVENSRYAQTTGPLTNIHWNLNAVPRVNHLRSRIQMHNMRIEHVLRPFQIDLITNLHRHLDQRLTSIDSNILSIDRHLQSLIEQKFPEVASDIRRRAEKETNPIIIPSRLARTLDTMLQHHQMGRPPTLSELVDCFLKHFKKTLAHLSPTSSVRLVKCQYLINLMKELDEMKSASRLSHWPGYIRALEADLSHECLQFKDELQSPSVFDLDDDAFVIWPTDSVLGPAPPPVATTDYELLIKISVVADAKVGGCSTLALHKHLKLGHRFRIIEECSPSVHSSNANIPRLVDLDIRTAVLIPIYADPVPNGAHRPPLALVLENGYGSYRYTFLDLGSLLLFQQYLTGYEVASTCMEARAAFVRGGNKKTIENVTVQIWIPFNSQRQPQPEPQGFRRRTSSTSTGWAPSISSVSSGGSSGSDDTVAVRLDNKAANTGLGYGIMRRLPSPPLLVLFTRSDDAKSRSIVTIILHDDTDVNPDRCQCRENPDCRISSLEQRRGLLKLGVLDAHKLGSGSAWSVLSLPRAMPRWEDLLRISIIFPDLGARHRMMGCLCNCSLRTEVDVNECIGRKHQGLLGIVKVLYRRSMVEYRRHGDCQEHLRR